MRLKSLLILLGILLPTLSFGQTKIDYNTQIINRPPANFIYLGVLAGIPAGCHTGNLAYITDVPAGQNIYACNSGTWTQASGGNGAAISVNGVLNVVQNQVNFLNSSSFNGLTNTFTYVAGGGIQLGFSGILGVGGGGSGVNTITGPIKGNGTSAFSQAAAADIYGLWSGCSNTTFLRGDGTCQVPIGTGSVSSFSSGNLVPLFTTSVATSTTTPALSFTLSNAAAHTYLGNSTGSTAAPAYSSIVAGDLPSTTVNSTVNDSNVTGSISGQALTFGWTGQLPASRGGTNNAFFQVTGPASVARTFTFPNASATVLTTNALVTVAQGGSGVATITGPIKGNGTSAFTAAVASDIYGLWSGSCSSSTFLRGDGSCQTPSGAGTVTSFSAGTLSPIFTTSVATATSTPALTFSLSTAAAHTYLGNNTGSTGSPAYSTIVAADLPATAVNAVTNDTNVTGSISGQTLTLGWTGVLAAGRGGTGSAFYQVAGPTAIRTFTYPDANATVLTTNSAVTVAQGGTGAVSLSGPLKGNGTSPFTIAISSDIISLWTGTCDNTTFLRADGSCQTAGGTGTGTVTTFTAGNLTPLFTTGVTNPTSTPNLTFTLTNAAANTVFGNCTGSTAAPSFCSLVAGQLPSTTVNSVVNDTNVTGSISAQALTLGWTGTLAAGRLNGNVVQSFVNDTNVTGSITAQVATLGWTGTLAVARGGIGVGTITGPMKGNGTSAVTAAVASDIYGLWSGCNSTTFLRGDGTCITPSGTGTVTGFSSGSLAPLFTTSVATSTTTPSLSFILSTALAHKYLGNNTGSTTSPAYVSIVAGDLPATTVNSVTNDTNIQGSISAQTLTLTWAGLLSGLRGGTNNGFFQVTGPTTSVKTFTYPDASANVLTDNALVTVAQGGTGVGTLTGPIKGNGTSPFTVAVSADIIALWSGSCNNTSFLRGDGTCASGTGTGTVTSFSSGNLSPVFTTSVANSTTTPALSFNLSTANAHTYLGNNTGVSGTPAYSSIVAGDLPSTVPNSVTNDVNVTGSISSQVLTLGWSGILSFSRGGTGSAFFNVTGPTVPRTYTFPDSAATVLTSANLVTVAQGGTGAGTLTGPIKGNGTSAFTAALSADIIGLWSGTCNNTTFLRADGVCASGSGTGSVTSFSAGNLSPLFTTTVTSPTSTPALSFTLSTATAHTYFGNNTGSTATPGFATIVAGDLPTTTVNSVVNDTNVTGSISAQALTLGWTGLLAASRGGTNNGFFQIAGPASSTKTFTLPNASANILTDNTAVTPAQGGTGLSSPTAHSLMVAEGSSNFNLVNSPTTNGQYVCEFNVTGSAALDPTCVLQGVGIDPQTGASYTVPTSDNVTLITASNSGAQAYAGPALASNIVFSIFNINTGLVTYTPNSGQVNGASTQIIPGSWFATAYTDNSLTRMPVVPTIGAFPNCTDSAGNHLNFTAATGAISCGTTASGGAAFPATVSGTVTSGGIPYFSSTTVESSSGILNTNILVKGGGAGGAPTNSSITDDGTRISSAEPVSSINFTAGGGTHGGAVILGQGSANGHSVANYAVLESPAAVTAYEWLLPAAAATGLPLLTNASSVMTQSFLTSTANGDILTGTGTTWSIFAGNASGTKFLTEDASGNMSWTGGTGAALSALTAATTTNTLADGNNPQIWNWAQTTDSQAGIKLGETSAATGGTLTSSLFANQSNVTVSTASASTATPLAVLQGSITGTTNYPAAQIQTTWNNAGLTTANALIVSATVTAGGGKLLNLLAGSGGTTSEFSVDNNGAVIDLGGISTGGAIQATSPTLAVTVHGGTDALTAGSANGSLTARGAGNTSTTANSAGGAGTFKGGDATGSTANLLIGGLATVSGGNITVGTGTTSTAGNVKLVGGSCTAVASASLCPGEVIVDQPYFTTGTANANDLACVTAGNTVASCSGTTTGTFIGVIDSVTSNNAFISSLAAGGRHTFKSTSATFTNGNYVCQDPAAANQVVNQSTACPAGTGIGIYVGSTTAAVIAPVVLMMPGQGGSSPILSSLAAASASNTIANGNNPQIWNWAQTTDSQSGIKFGETSAATTGSLTGVLANQSNVKISTAAASTAAPLIVSQGSLTATTGPPALQIQTTWNNASLVGQGLVFSVVDTSHAGSSKLLNLYGGSSGTTSLFSVDTLGGTTVADVLRLTGTPASGSGGSTLPMAYLNAGTAPTTFSGNGTELGVNSPSGFTGNMLDFHVNGGASVASLDYQGNIAATSLLVSGIVDGKAPITITTGATATLGGTYNSGYTFNQEATAATAITYTLPTAAAGLQYCVGNSYNGSAPTTGTLEILTSASGQFIIFTDGTLSATGGFVQSGGAGGDAACVVGVDSTHWQLYVQAGTWTKH